MHTNSIQKTIHFNGALLIHKSSGVSSFGIIEKLKQQLLKFGNPSPALKKKDLPKMGHGGTLDPFATGLLVVLVGRGVKLARYSLGSKKTYEGTVRFGETTVPGDPTAPISETSSLIPTSIHELRELAHQWTQGPYLQTPPMHSALKVKGRPLYELAHSGIEVERAPRECRIFEFEIREYHPPIAEIRVQCSAGTYIRTLAQDYARQLGTVALLEKLHRTRSGQYSIEKAWTLDQIAEATQNETPWDQLPCWIPFDRLLEGYARAEATESERLALSQGKQSVLPKILQTVCPTSGGTPADWVAIYCGPSLIAVARKENDLWGIERVF